MEISTKQKLGGFVAAGGFALAAWNGYQASQEIEDIPAYAAKYEASQIKSQVQSQVKDKVGSVIDKVTGKKTDTPAATTPEAQVESTPEHVFNVIAGKESIKPWLDPDFSKHTVYTLDSAALAVAGLVGCARNTAPKQTKGSKR